MNMLSSMILQAVMWLVHSVLFDNQLISAHAYLEVLARVNVKDASKFSSDFRKIAEDMVYVLACKAPQTLPVFSFHVLYRHFQFSRLTSYLSYILITGLERYFETATLFWLLMEGWFLHELICVKPLEVQSTIKRFVAIGWGEYTEESCEERISVNNVISRRACDRHSTLVDLPHLRSVQRRLLGQTRRHGLHHSRIDIRYVSGKTRCFFFFFLSELHFNDDRIVSGQLLLFLEDHTRPVRQDQNFISAAAEENGVQKMGQIDVHARAAIRSPEFSLLRVVLRRGDQDQNFIPTNHQSYFLVSGIQASVGSVSFILQS